ncbi:alpha/beta hydrolase [Gillisia sp. Hel_I_29]|uniref:alpha/beta hydrolase n=1 Tax=Gillisia sp. Hel_I_29 TaxID=1249975 RepID=UPI0009DD2117|nr:alpha/beta hydrolase [Gillisia sp. Hel_I_29]
MKITKYLLLIVLFGLFGIFGYVYYLTFTPHGRLNWGQAVFLKMTVNDSVSEIAYRLKKMTVIERSHLIDQMPINLEGLSVDTLKITSDSLTTYIFKSKNFDKNSPVVIYYHGGAFVLPWTNLSVSYATRLARLYNGIVVSVDYRVAPEYPFPIPNNDCYATFLWTISNIENWGGNPKKIIVAGESAGATFASLVSIKAKEENLANIKYQILECPAIYSPLETTAYQNFKIGYYLQEPEMKYGLQSYLPNTADLTNPLAFPFYSDNLSNMPPSYIVTSEFDPLKDTGKNFAEKLKNANVPIIHKEMKGMIHSIPGPFNEKDREDLYKEIRTESQKYLN